MGDMKKLRVDNVAPLPLGQYRARHILKVGPLTRTNGFESEGNSDVESLSNTPKGVAPRKRGPKALTMRLSGFATPSTNRSDPISPTFSDRNSESGNESNDSLDADRFLKPYNRQSSPKLSLFSKNPSGSPKANDVKEESFAVRPPSSPKTLRSMQNLIPSTPLLPVNLRNKHLESIRRQNKQTYHSDSEAKSALKKAKKQHPFRHLIFGPTLDEERFKHHIALTYKGLVYSMKSLKSPSEKFVNSKAVELRSLAQRPKTLCLDLDETLIHRCGMNNNPEVVLTTMDDLDKEVHIPIKLRPHLQDFLKKMSALFDIVIFTASTDYYAEAIVRYIDPSSKFISHLLTRQNCMETRNGFYIKDLRILQRELKDVVLVDNLSHSFGFQIENGIPILEYTCLLYTSPSPRDRQKSRMPSSA
eukprot:TRINITY_DN7356_c0_g2_i3.p1 TRINITY_DN7356_c0_g2~~TRINITY_DN7356_c0_g2_i3.p1  ORF type:complete len:417 (+),score=59.69 TRINITY_DN7356_c0_g2_i3:2-1252(+)